MTADIAYWISSPIDHFLKYDKNQDIEDINVIFEFAIDIAARATQISLQAFTHVIAMQLKARNKKATKDTSNVIFETTLELIQNISVIMR